MTETQSPLRQLKGAHDTDFDSEEDLSAAFQAATTTADDDDYEAEIEPEQEIMKHIDSVLAIVRGPGMDSQKTERLSQLLATVDEKVAGCFVGDGQWNSSTQRFEGAPQWPSVISRLEKLRDETLSQDMRVELDLDEMLIDAFSRGTDGYMSFSDFQMMLAEADKEG